MATIKEIITKIEGNKSAPYYDGVGEITIGIGFNIEKVSTSRNAVFSSFPTSSLGMHMKTSM